MTNTPSGRKNKLNLVAIFCKIALYLVVWCVCAFMCSLKAHASTEGALHCSTIADNATVGTAIWVTTANACSSNNLYDTALLTGVARSHYLKLTNFGFSTIGNQDSVDGIQVAAEVNGTTNGANQVDEDDVILVKAGTIQSTDKATGVQWPTTDTVLNYGSTSDKWGDTWSGLDIKDTGFGVVISAIGHSSAGSKTVVASVDDVTITVTYHVVRTRRVTILGMIFDVHYRVTRRETRTIHL